MDLVGSWLRQLVKAGTAATLVPVAIVIALVVVVAGAGGLGGLGSLGQLVSGPQISSAERAAVTTTRDRSAAEIVAPPAIASAEPTAQPPSTQVPSRRSQRGDSAPAPDRAPAPRPSPPPPSPPPPPAATPPVAVDQPPARPPPPPAPPTVEDRTEALVGDLGDVVDEVVVVLEKVIEGLGRTLDRVLNVPPPGR